MCNVRKIEMYLFELFEMCLSTCYNESNWCERDRFLFRNCVHFKITTRQCFRDLHADFAGGECTENFQFQLSSEKKSFHDSVSNTVSVRFRVRFQRLNKKMVGWRGGECILDFAPPVSSDRTAPRVKELVQTTERQRVFKHADNTNSACACTHVRK